MRYRVWFKAAVTVEADGEEEAKTLAEAQSPAFVGCFTAIEELKPAAPPEPVPTLYTVGVVYEDGSYVTLVPPSPELRSALEYRPQFAGALVLRIEPNGVPIPVRRWDGTKWELVE